MTPTGMRRLASLAAAALLGAIASAAPLPANLKPLKRSAKVYKGPEGEKITMVFLEKNDSGDVLIRFDDVDGDWNGKTLLHTRHILRDWGDPKADFTATVDGSPWTSVVIRGTQVDQNGQKYPDMIVSLKGAGSDFHIRYSESDSKAADVDGVIREFRREVGTYGEDGELKKDAAEKARQANAQAVQLYTAGKKAQAIVAWQKLLDIDPLNDHARENIRTATAELDANN